MFRACDFQYFSYQMRGDILPKCKLYLLSDLASSTKKDSDYRVLMLIGVDEDGFWYVLECRYGRWQATEYLDHMFDMVQTYRLPKVYPEDGQILQTLDSIIKQKQEAERVYFVIEPIKHKGRSKQARIELLQPRFRAKKILFEADAPYLEELEHELLSFTVTGTKALHDDLADILAYGEDVCRPPLRLTRRSEVLSTVDGGLLL